MKVIFALALAAAVATSAAAQAPVPTAQPVSTATAAKPDDNARVCKTLTITGSRLPTRICLTRGEWRAKAEQAKKDTEDQQRRGLTTCATRPCGG